MKDIEIGKGLDEIHFNTQDEDGSDRAVYKPHPDYPFVEINMTAIELSMVRLNAFMGLDLPREAYLQIVSAYLSYGMSTKGPPSTKSENLS